MTPQIPNAATDQPNLAGVRPLAKEFDANGKPQKPFNDWLRSLCSQLDQQDDPVWKELALVWELINHFINGDQLLRRGHRFGGWQKVPLPSSTMSSVRQQNKLGFYSRALMAKWVASRTKVQAIAGDDADESVGAARAAQAFIDALEPMLYPEDFRQREGLAAQAHGTYARYFYFDAEAEDGGYGQRPITEQREFGGGEDTAECFDCGFVAAQPGMVGSDGRDGEGLSGADVGLESGSVESGLVGGAICSQCGSPNVQVTPATTETIEVVTGQEQYKLGRIKTMTVPYAELRHELAQSAEDSPWLRWRRRVRIEELKTKFPGLKIPASGERDKDTGLAMEERLRRSLPQSSRGTGRNQDQSHDADFTQWWFAPCMYQDYTFPVDVETVAGEIIPAGSKATDIFPDGMYIARVDGIDAPVQVRNESHRDHWVTAPYHIRNFTRMGLGINDAVEMQRQWNAVLSLVFEQIRTASLPGWLYDKDAISSDDVKLLGQPQNNVPVSTRNREPGTRLEQLVHRMEPGQVPSHLFAYVQLLDANMQTIAGALVNEGVPGVDSKTATGAQIMQQSAQAHNLPEYALKGDADVRSMQLCFKLAKKFYQEPRYFPLKGKRGKQDGIWLSAADFANGQIRFEAAPDSYLPHTKADKQEAIQKLFLAFGNAQAFMMALATKPDFVASVAQTFGLEIDDLADTNYDAAVEVSRQRIDQLEELVPQFAPIAQQMMLMAQVAPEMLMQPGAVDPMTGMQAPPTMIDPMQMIAQEIIGQLKPPIIPEEPAHQVSIEWLRSWLLDDDGKECDDLMRACVQAMIRTQIEMMALEAQVMAGLSQIGQPQPPPDAQGAPPAQKTEADKRQDQARSQMGGQPGGATKRPSPRPQPQPA